jgi:cation diffusion facilitator family transporter
MDTSNLKIKAAVFSLVIGLVIFVAKISAFIITDSSAIFSDAAESVIHILATLLVVYSIYISNKPPDKSHFYGHGNIEYFSAGIEGFLIILAAISIMYFAIMDIILGPQPENLDTGTIIIAAAGTVNMFVGFYLVNQGKITNSIALVADGKHILTDAFTSIGVVIGLILILITGYVMLDPIIAIVVASNIIFTGIKLIRQSVGGLMNETDTAILLKLAETLKSIKKSTWIDIHHLKFWSSADRLYMDFHLTLPYYYSIKQSHEEEEYISNKIKKIFPLSEVRVHMDFCTDTLCRYCCHSDCSVRTAEKKEDINWSVDKMTGEPVNFKDHIT